MTNQITLTAEKTKSSASLVLIVAFVVALVAALAIALPAQAQAKETSRDWTVEFTGNEMVDQGAANIAKTISGMQPGDSVRFNVALYESADESARWYMQNKVLKSMEEALNSGGSYTYSLVYTSPSGTKKTIISNDSVSGENGGGLFDATEATGDWFYLDTLAAGERAKVELRVELDGETHGNSYFNTSAQIELAFAAEPPSGEMYTTTNSDQPSGKKDNGSDLPQTGDIINAMIWIVVAGGAVLLIARAVSKRREIESSKEGDAR